MKDTQRFTKLVWGSIGFERHLLISDLYGGCGSTQGCVKIATRRICVEVW